MLYMSWYKGSYTFNTLELTKQSGLPKDRWRYDRKREGKKKIQFKYNTTKCIIAFRLSSHSETGCHRRVQICRLQRLSQHFLPWLRPFSPWLFVQFFVWPEFGVRIPLLWHGTLEPAYLMRTYSGLPSSGPFWQPSEPLGSELGKEREQWISVSASHTL